MSAPFSFMLRCERTAALSRSMADVVAAVDHAAAAASEDRRSRFEAVHEDRIDDAAFARDPHFVEPEARELRAAVRREAPADAHRLARVRGKVIAPVTEH